MGQEEQGSLEFSEEVDPYGVERYDFDATCKDDPTMQWAELVKEGRNRGSDYDSDKVLNAWLVYCFGSQDAADEARELYASDNMQKITVPHLRINNKYIKLMHHCICVAQEMARVSSTEYPAIVDVIGARLYAVRCYKDGIKLTKVRGMFLPVTFGYYRSNHLRLKSGVDSKEPLKPVKARKKKAKKPLKPVKARKKKAKKKAEPAAFAPPPAAPEPAAPSPKVPDVLVSEDSKLEEALQGFSVKAGKVGEPSEPSVAKVVGVMTFAAEHVLVNLLRKYGAADPREAASRLSRSIVGTARDRLQVSDKWDLSTLEGFEWLRD